jgi:hypothetical protein
MGGILGGGGSKSTSTTNGFNALPEDIRATFSNLSQGINQQLLQPNSGQAFAPLAQTADETRAFDILRQGFAPTASSLQNDMSMLMNPYNQNVINEMNRQAGGQFSTLNDALNQSGQLGSNRTILGANDVDMARQNQIGSFLSNQYNQNMGYALNQLPALRQADSQALLGIGEFQRNQNAQQQQAPISALMAAAQAMGVLPTSEGSGTSTTKSGGGGIMPAIGAAGGLLSGLGAVGAFGSGASGITWNSPRIGVV